MSLSLSVRAGTPLNTSLYVGKDVTGSVSVEYSKTSNFDSILVTKTVTPTARQVTLALTASEVDTVQTCKFRVKDSTTNAVLETGSIAYLKAAPSNGPVVNAVATSGSALTLPDVSVATFHDVTLSANCTVTFPAPVAGKTVTIRLTQGTGGSKTVTWPATVKWAGGTAPTLSTAAGKQDILTFVSVGGTTWSGHVFGLDLR